MESNDAAKAVLSELEALLAWDSSVEKRGDNFSTEPSPLYSGAESSSATVRVPSESPEKPRAPLNVLPSNVRHTPADERLHSSFPFTYSADGDTRSTGSHQFKPQSAMRSRTQSRELPIAAKRGIDVLPLQSGPRRGILRDTTPFTDPNWSRRSVQEQLHSWQHNLRDSATSSSSSSGGRPLETKAAPASSGKGSTRRHSMPVLRQREPRPHRRVSFVFRKVGAHDAPQALAPRRPPSFASAPLESDAPHPSLAPRRAPFAPITEPATISATASARPVHTSSLSAAGVLSPTAGIFIRPVEAHAPPYDAVAHRVADAVARSYALLSATSAAGREQLHAPTTAGLDENSAATRRGQLKPPTEDTSAAAQVEGPGNLLIDPRSGLGSSGQTVESWSTANVDRINPQRAGPIQRSAQLLLPSELRGSGAAVPLPCTSTATEVEFGATQSARTAATAAVSTRTSTAAAAASEVGADTGSSGGAEYDAPHAPPAAAASASAITTAASAAAFSGLSSTSPIAVTPATIFDPDVGNKQQQQPRHSIAAVIKSLVVDLEVDEDDGDRSRRPTSSFSSTSSSVRAHHPPRGTETSTLLRAASAQRPPPTLMEVARAQVMLSLQPIAGARARIAPGRSDSRNGRGTDATEPSSAGTAASSPAISASRASTSNPIIDDVLRDFSNSVIVAADVSGVAGHSTTRPPLHEVDVSSGSSTALSLPLLAVATAAVSSCSSWEPAGLTTRAVLHWVNALASPLRYAPTVDAFAARATSAAPANATSTAAASSSAVESHVHQQQQRQQLQCPRDVAAAVTSLHHYLAKYAGARSATLRAVRVLSSSSRAQASVELAESLEHTEEIERAASEATAAASESAAADASAAAASAAAATAAAASSTVSASSRPRPHARTVSALLSMHVRIASASETPPMTGAASPDALLLSAAHAARYRAALTHELAGKLRARHVLMCMRSDAVRARETRALLLLRSARVLPYYSARVFIAVLRCSVALRRLQRAAAARSRERARRRTATEAFAAWRVFVVSARAAGVRAEVASQLARTRALDSAFRQFRACVLLSRAQWGAHVVVAAHWRGRATRAALRCWREFASASADLRSRLVHVSSSSSGFGTARGERPQAPLVDANTARGAYSQAPLIDAQVPRPVPVTMQTSLPLVGNERAVGNSDTTASQLSSSGAQHQLQRCGAANISAAAATLARVRVLIGDAAGLLASPRYVNLEAMAAIVRQQTQQLLSPAHTLAHSRGSSSTSAQARSGGSNNITTRSVTDSLQLHPLPLLLSLHNADSALHRRHAHTAIVRARRLAQLHFATTTTSAAGRVGEGEAVPLAAFGAKFAPIVEALRGVYTADDDDDASAITVIAPAVLHHQQLQQLLQTELHCSLFDDVDVDVGSLAESGGSTTHDAHQRRQDHHHVAHPSNERDDSSSSVQPPLPPPTAPFLTRPLPLHSLLCDAPHAHPPLPLQLAVRAWALRASATRALLVWRARASLQARAARLRASATRRTLTRAWDTWRSVTRLGAHAAASVAWLGERVRTRGALSTWRAAAATQSRAREDAMSAAVDALRVIRAVRAWRAQARAQRTLASAAAALSRTHARALALSALRAWRARTRTRAPLRAGVAIVRTHFARASAVTLVLPAWRLFAARRALLRRVFTGARERAAAAAAAEVDAPKRQFGMLVRFLRGWSALAHAAAEERREAAAVAAVRALLECTARVAAVAQWRHHARVARSARALRAAAERRRLASAMHAWAGAAAGMRDTVRAFSSAPARSTALLRCAIRTWRAAAMRAKAAAATSLRRALCGWRDAAADAADARLCRVDATLGTLRVARALTQWRRIASARAARRSSIVAFIDARALRLLSRSWAAWRSACGAEGRSAQRAAAAARLAAAAADYGWRHSSSSGAGVGAQLHSASVPHSAPSQLSGDASGGGRQRHHQQFIGVADGGTRGRLSGGVGISSDLPLLPRAHSSAFPAAAAAATALSGAVAPTETWMFSPPPHDDDERGDVDIVEDAVGSTAAGQRQQLHAAASGGAAQPVYLTAGASSVPVSATVSSSVAAARSSVAVGTASVIALVYGGGGGSGAQLQLQGGAVERLASARQSFMKYLISEAIPTAAAAAGSR